MKKKNTSFKLIIICGALLSTLTLKAQVDWHVAGNAGTTSANYVGTSDSMKLDFKTANVVRMHINGTQAAFAGKVGYVGIGTALPATLLHVNGVITATGGTSTAWNTAVTRVPAGTTSRVPRWSGTAYVAGTIFDNATNVGIGTTAPTQKLHVVGNILTSGTVTSLGGNSTNWNTAFGWGNHATAGYLSAETDPQVGANTTNRVPRWNGSALIAGTIYDNATNVGIGTTTPQNKLSVVGSLDISGSLGIGTTAPSYPFDFLGSSAFGRIKGTSGSAGLILDKATATDNEYLIHQQGGSDKWVEGTVGDNNFCIRNWPLGANAISINAANNYVGIGMPAPTGYPLQVRTAGYTAFGIDGATGNESWTHYLINGGFQVATGFRSTANNYVIFAGGDRLVVSNATGNVGIGTTTPAYKLDVCGTVRAKEVRVETGWCDYVFAKDYKLPALSDVEAYINIHKHLPDVTPGAEIESEGLEVGKVSAQMIKKIEELTLYVINQEKAINELKAQNAQLESKVNSMVDKGGK